MIIFSHYFNKISALHSIFNDVLKNKKMSLRWNLLCAFKNLEMNLCTITMKETKMKNSCIALGNSLDEILSKNEFQSK